MPFSAPTIRSTTAGLSALPATGKTHDLSDAAVAGLVLRVGPTGRKRWLFRICRFKGRGSWMVRRCAWNFCSGLAGRMTLVLDDSEILLAPQKRVQPSPPYQPKTALRPAPRRGNNLAAIEIVIDGQRDSR
jgi:hypothetical protein